MTWPVFFTAYILAVIGIGSLFLVRNNRVWRFSQRLVRLIHETNQREISRYDFDTWTERWKAESAVSYYSMFWRFWRPLPDFFRGSLIEDLARKAAE